MNDLFVAVMKLYKYDVFSSIQTVYIYENSEHMIQFHIHETRQKLNVTNCHHQGKKRWRHNKNVRTVYP